MTDLVPLLLIVFWISFTVMNGMIAKEKGRDVTSIVAVSIFLSPLTAYAYLLAVPPLQSLNTLVVQEPQSRSNTTSDATVESSEPPLPSIQKKAKCFTCSKFKSNFWNQFKGTCTHHNRPTTSSDFCEFGETFRNQ